MPIATASMPDLPRVLREAISQIRDLPVWSTYSIFLRVAHFASLVERSVMDVMWGSWDGVDMVKWRVGGVETSEKREVSVMSLGRRTDDVIDDMRGVLGRR